MTLAVTKLKFESVSVIWVADVKGFDFEPAFLLSLSIYIFEAENVGSFAINWSAASQLFIGVNLGSLLQHFLGLSAQVVLLLELSLHHNALLMHLLPRNFVLPNRLFLRLVLRLKVNFALHWSLAGPSSKSLRFWTETGCGHVWLETTKGVLVWRFGAIASRRNGLWIKSSRHI